MKRKHKVYFKINFVSLFFVAISFISITLAWFAYSGLAKVGTDVDVKAWHIEFKKDSKTVSNNVVISLSDIYPGMDTVNEIINVQNLGDSDAQLKYSIKSARILDEDNYSLDNQTSSYIEDSLSHNYPFHININLSKKYALAKGEDGVFQVSVSWPLDSNNDETDSLWGNKAYEFQSKEETKKANDNNYSMRTSIKIMIDLTAEQYITNNNAIDYNYNLGQLVLYDIRNNKKCSTVSTTCIRTHIIDTNNKVGDTTVSLLPAFENTYGTGTYNDYNSILSNIASGWNVVTRPLQVNDILKIISNDINKSTINRDNISNSIIGYLGYDNRMDTTIINTSTGNGYYSFNNQSYIYLSNDNCVWLNNDYDSTRSFALKKADGNATKLYGETKTNTCKVVPVIVASKDSLK